MIVAEPGQVGRQRFHDREPAPRLGFRVGLDVMRFAWPALIGDHDRQEVLADLGQVHHEQAAVLPARAVPDGVSRQFGGDQDRVGGGRVTGEAARDEITDDADLIAAGPEHLRRIHGSARQGAPGHHRRAEPAVRAHRRAERAFLDRGRRVLFPGPGHPPLPGRHCPYPADRWILRMVPARVLRSAACAMVPGGTLNRG